jgi:hypothetical protein
LYLCVICVISGIVIISGVVVLSGMTIWPNGGGGRGGTSLTQSRKGAKDPGGMGVGGMMRHTYDDTGYLFRLSRATWAQQPTCYHRKELHRGCEVTQTLGVPPLHFATGAMAKTPRVGKRMAQSQRRTSRAATTSGTSARGDAGCQRDDPDELQLHRAAAGRWDR